MEHGLARTGPSIDYRAIAILRVPLIISVRAPTAASVQARLHLYVKLRRATPCAHRNYQDVGRCLRVNVLDDNAELILVYRSAGTSPAITRQNKQVCSDSGFGSLFLAINEMLTPQRPGALFRKVMRN